MNGSLGSISAETGTKRLRCISLGSGCVGGSNKLSPAGNGVGSDELHTSDNIAGDELGQVGEEGLALMLRVELAGGLLAELGHLELVDHETVRLD